MGAVQTLLAECEQAAAGGDRLTCGMAAHARGIAGLLTGDSAAAVAGLAEAVEIFREADELNRLVEALIGLALATGFTGDSARSISCHEEVIAITRPRGELWSQAYSLWAYGLALWRQGDDDRAVTMLEDSLRLKGDLGDLLGTVWCLEALAFIAGGTGHHERAATLLGAAAALSRDAGTQAATFPDLATSYDECERAARRALGDKRFEAVARRGSGFSVDAATAYALGEQQAESRGNVDSGQLLTRREQEVAALIAEGLTNRSIAARLVISQRTAQGHVENILSKLGFTSRTQVAAWVTDRSHT